MTKEPLRILLLDDDVDLALLTGEMLATVGHGVCEPVNDAETAIDLLRQETFDLCILDVRLEGGTSQEVAVEANRLDLPVILMSGAFDRGMMEGWPEAAVCITKPVHPDQWAEAIAEAMQSAGRTGV